MIERRKKEKVEREEGKRWPDLPVAPDSAFRLKEYLVTIDHKGVATRSDLLKIAGSSTELNSWLRDLVKRFDLVEEITEGARRLYRKTAEGRRMELVLTDYWYHAKLLVTLYSRERRIPFTEQPQS